MDWQPARDFPAELDVAGREALAGLKPVSIKAKTILFRPGDEAKGFVVVLSGKIGVHLVGKNGRELELYSVSRGETCVQTTLGMLGAQAYSAEAVAETDLVAIIIPAALFERLMAQSARFRSFVFKAFATRVGDVMFVLEQVAFARIDQRLASALLERAGPSGQVYATQQELANAIGSAREVVSRQLKTFAARGLISVERNRVHILDRPGLKAMVEAEI